MCRLPCRILCMKPCLVGKVQRRQAVQTGGPLGDRSCFADAQSPLCRRLGNHGAVGLKEVQIRIRQLGWSCSKNLPPRRLERHLAMATMCSRPAAFDWR